MKEICFEGITFGLTTGKDTERNGVYVELNVVDKGDRRVVAEVFCYSGRGDIVLKTSTEEVPIELIEFLIEESKAILNIRTAT